MRLPFRIAGAVARRILPAGTPARRAVSVARRGVRGARAGAAAEMRQARLEIEVATGTRPVGVDTYREWREQRPAVAEHAVLSSIAVVVELARDGDEVASATRESVAAISGVEVALVAAASGSRIADLASRVDADLVLLLRDGDRLAPETAFVLDEARRAEPAADLISIDADVPTGRGREPRFQPRLSPDTLLSANPFGRAFALRGRVLATAGDETLDDLGIWKLLLRADLDARRTTRATRVLLHSARVETIPDGRAARMVEAVLAECGARAVVRAEAGAGALRIAFEPETWPTVSIVIPTRHGRANLERLLPSLAMTDYPGAVDVRIVDNGGEDPEQIAWYAARDDAIDLTVDWWHEQPFNYSRVNTVTARRTSGDVIVLLNDDTEIVRADWLRLLVGHLARDGVGTVGLQLRTGDGLVQHGGVLIGPGGFADNMFAGMRPGESTMIGHLDWIRNSVAVTGACVAIRREHFEEVGGLDDRFQLTGSDVVLGLDQIIRGRRNVVIAEDVVRHFESITRGSSVPEGDFHASWWRYLPWLQHGDPYWSPNLTPLRSTPRLAAVGEERPVELTLRGLGRGYRHVQQTGEIAEEARGLWPIANADAALVRSVAAAHEDPTPRPVETINWWFPDLDTPYFGGVNTALRIAAKLLRDRGVRSRFVVLASPNEPFIRSAIAAAFPELADSEIVFFDAFLDDIDDVPRADAAIATLWLTAYFVARAPAGRRFYLVQDYEPGFYPASSMYGMAEETYRLGLYGICNTASMLSSLEEYGGRGIAFTPAVDQGIYAAEGRRRKADDEPVTIFAYARDHFRNCWELVMPALARIKEIHGDGVRIVAAGARYLPPTAGFVDLGLLDYRATGGLYRETDIGLTMQISRHPSYLPLELMSSGVPMVAPDSSWFSWLFEHEGNSLTAMRTVDSIVEQLDRLVRDRGLRDRLSAGALATIGERHADWDAALAGVLEFLDDPEGVLARRDG